MFRQGEEESFCWNLDLRQLYDRCQKFVRVNCDKTRTGSCLHTGVKDGAR